MRCSPPPTAACRRGCAATWPAAARCERLVLRVNGVVADAPVKPSNHVSGIDLGPGTTPGAIVAVYTRCTGGLFHERCSIYELDVASGQRAPRVGAGHAPREHHRAVGVGRALRLRARRRSRAASAPGATSASTPACAAPSGSGSRRPGSTDVDANVVAYADGTAGTGGSSTTRSASAACAAGPTASSPRAPSAWGAAQRQHGDRAGPVRAGTSTGASAAASAPRRCTSCACRSPGPTASSARSSAGRSISRR